MGSTEQIRSTSSRLLGGAMVVAGALGFVSAAVGGIDAVLRYGAPTLLFALLGWAAFWRPHVVVSDGGVTVVNTLRTVEVPWPAIEGVEGRYGLRLRTAYGPVTAWAAGAPAGRQRARAHDSSTRLEELRGAGYLDDPRLERPALVTTWHAEVVGPVAVLVVASVVLPLLA